MEDFTGLAGQEQHHFDEEGGHGDLEREGSSVEDEEDGDEEEDASINSLPNSLSDIPTGNRPVSDIIIEKTKIPPGRKPHPQHFSLERMRMPSKADLEPLIRAGITENIIDEIIASGLKQRINMFMDKLNTLAIDRGVLLENIKKTKLALETLVSLTWPPFVQAFVYSPKSFDWFLGICKIYAPAELELARTAEVQGKISFRISPKGNCTILAPNFTDVTSIISYVLAMHEPSRIADFKPFLKRIDLIYRNKRQYFSDAYARLLRLSLLRKYKRKNTSHSENGDINDSSSLKNDDDDDDTVSDQSAASEQSWRICTPSTNPLEENRHCAVTGNCGSLGKRSRLDQAPQADHTAVSSSQHQLFQMCDGSPEPQQQLQHTAPPTISSSAIASSIPSTEHTTHGSSSLPQQAIESSQLLGSSKKSSSGSNVIIVDLTEEEDSTAPTDIPVAHHPTTASYTFSADVSIWDRNVYIIESEFAHKFFIESPRHAAVYIYNETMQLIDKLQHYNSRWRQEVKQRLYEMVQHIIRRGSTQNVNEELWNCFLGVYKIYKEAMVRQSSRN